MWVSSARGAKKVNPILCCTSKTASSNHREMVLPLFGPCETTAGAMPSLDLPSKRKTWMYWSGSGEGSPVALEGWRAGHTRRGWGTWVCSVWGREDTGQRCLCTNNYLMMQRQSQTLLRRIQQMDKEPWTQVARRKIQIRYRENILHHNSGQILEQAPIKFSGTSFLGDIQHLTSKS